jgi:hypothetical protein
MDFVSILLKWLPYYIFGYVGIFMYIVSSLGVGDTIPSWVKSHNKDFWMSLLSYNAIIFLWYDMGFEFFGLLKGIPTGTTFFVGWFGNSLLNKAVKQYGDRIQKPSTDPGAPTP